MKTTLGLLSPLSRRAILRATVAGVVSTAIPGNLYAGLPDARAFTAITFDGDSIIVAGQSLSRSDNQGVSWEKLPLAVGVELLTLATHPDSPGRIIAGLDGHNGVLLSEDGGRTWVVRSSGLPDKAVLAITAAVALPDTFYASVQDDGLWKSQNAGQTWEFVMDRPWIKEAERDLLTLASVNLATGMGGIWIYAGTGIGLTRVPDCFCRWQDVQPGNAMDALVSGEAPPHEAPLPAGETIRSLVSAPSAPEILYAALPSGVWFSGDGGVVWSCMLSGDATAVAVHPVNAKYIIAAIDSGLKQSRDSGNNWTALAAI